MMRGTKRSATSDITSVFNSNDSSKRAIVGSTFEGRRAESSAFPQPLDTQRAESSRQHVKALNNQFASWVQTQLTNHPDELWEDGVQDYLSHAKSIMEKFSDVVNWLKENSAKGDSFRELRSNDNLVKPTSEINKDNHKSFFSKPEFPPAAKLRSNDNVVKPTSEIDKDKQKSLFSKPEFPPAAKLRSNENVVKHTSEINKDNPKSFFSKPEFTPAANLSSGNVVKPTFSSAATPSFGTSTIFNNNSPFSFGGSQSSIPGNINTVPSNHDVSNEADGEGDVEQPSSPSVQKSEEKGICVVHEVKCKLYVKSTDPADKDAWKDKGMGQLSIKCKEGVSKGSKESKPNIVMRNDVGKVVLNALLYSGIKTNKQKNSIVAIFHTSADNDNNETAVARTFLMKTKTEEDRDKLAAAIQEYAPVS